MYILSIYFCLSILSIFIYSIIIRIIIRFHMWRRAVSDNIVYPCVYYTTLSYIVGAEF